MKNTIIGHRGAAGLALENSAAALRAGIKAGASALEIDVRITQDGKLVLCHDANLRRVAGKNQTIRGATWNELKQITLKDGSNLLLLERALHIIGRTPVIIELKDDKSAPALVAVLKKYPEAIISVASFKAHRLINVQQLRPDIALYALTLLRPFHTLRICKKYGFRGLGLPAWVLQPFTYWSAHKHGLELYVYTINSKTVGNLLRRLYPGVAVCTNRPDRFTS